jgi:methylated-DNA-protein-cysteine methyltransferase-like protein
MGLDDLPFAELYTQIYEIIALIPRGKVATYGQIAHIVGPPCHARLVGWALRDTPRGLQIPWQRVINSRGEISTFHREAGARHQRQLLEEEGVEFGSNDRIDLHRFQWEGPDAAWLREHGYRVPPEDKPDSEQLGLL